MIAYILDVHWKACPFSRGVWYHVLQQRFANIATFTVISIFSLTDGCRLLLKESWFWKLLILHRNQEGFLLSPIYKAFKRYILDMTFFCQMADFRLFFCRSRISLIHLIYLSLPNLYFYTIRSIAILLQVLNKVHFKVLPQT